MGIRLTSLALIGLLTLGGCTAYYGEIGEDKVAIEKFLLHDVLIVTKPDGRKIKYRDDGKDKKGPQAKRRTDISI